MWPDQVVRILSEGLGSGHHPKSVHSPPEGMAPLSSPSTTAKVSADPASAATPAVSGTIGSGHSRIYGNARCAASSSLAAAAVAEQIDPVKALPFEVFLRACSIFFCFQVGWRMVMRKSLLKLCLAVIPSRWALLLVSDATHFQQTSRASEYPNYQYGIK